MAVSAADLEITIHSKGTAQVIGDLRQVDRAVESTGQKSSGMFRTMAATAGGFLIGGAIQSLGRSLVGLGTGFLTANADAETMRNSLEVATGSATEANDVFGQLQKMAASTPFEFPELMQTAVSLEALGVNAMDFMDVIGNTAAATGKSMDQVTQAFLDAAVGENERLKEFGIRAKTTGDMVTYTWMQNGKEMTATVDKNNQAVIQSTLAAIWNGKYEGAMQKQSQTFNGMLSTFKDNVNLTMQAASKPIFNFAKSGLRAANAMFTGFSEAAAKGMRPIPALLMGIQKGLASIGGENTPEWIANVARGFGAAGRSLQLFRDHGMSPMGAAFSAFRVGVVEAFGPEVEARIVGISHVIQNGLSTAASVVRGVFSALGSGVTLAITGIITVLGFLADHTDLVVGAVKGLGAAFLAWMGFSAVTAILTGIGAALAFLLSPIGLVIAAAVALGIAWQTNFLGIAWQTNFLGIRDIVMRVVDVVAGKVQQIITVFQELRSAGLDPIAAAVGALSAAFPFLTGVFVGAGTAIRILTEPTR